MFLLAIQIQQKFPLDVIQLLVIILQQIFAQLLCHVRNFVVITLLASRLEWNQISIELVKFSKKIY